METKTLNEMKGSEIHRIIAAVLEVIEKAGFETRKDADLQEAGTPESWKMVFYKKNTNLDELNGVKKELGKNFAVNVQPKDKTTLSVIVEAPSGDFITLSQRKQLAQPVQPGTIFDGENRPEDNN